MDKVQLDAIHPHLIVGKGVQGRLSLLPVKGILPVFRELLLFKPT